MAFVILSPRTLTNSKTRTVSAKLFWLILSLAMLVVLVTGFSVGMAMNDNPPAAAVPESVSESEVDAAPGKTTLVYTPESQILINRVGELSGRIVQLEMEAMELASKIGATKEFETRMQLGKEAKPGRTAKTPPGSPSGGPLLKPLDEKELANEKGVLAFPDVDIDIVPLSDDLVAIEADIAHLVDILTELNQRVGTVNVAHMSFPGRTPVKHVRATSDFGNRIDPIRNRSAFHSGIDFPAPRGTPIYASAGGKILFAGYRHEYGHTVEIDHGAGLVTRYAHASKLLVKTGQIVMPGQLIAKVGASGRTTGSHLHFEILRDGRFVNPVAYLARF